ncbi:MAG: metal-sensing transcriptional repressor [Marinibacterium sp.]|nr:metal-sensing transcriptional repressor [Marinibacterium sp.]
MSTHASHPAIITRLKRADGHLQSVIRMIEDERPCAEIAQQLSAVEKAITNAKRALIHDHLDHCLGSDHAIDDLRAIARYL